MNKSAKFAACGPTAVPASPFDRRMRRAAAASSPAVAGFRPAGLALAVAAALMGAGSAFGQPTGAQAIQGQALLKQQGTSLVVTTQNAPGTNRSVINWQSFSIPAGSTTRFDQPTAQSLSINRVVGNDPSAIYGTLSSNGRLVLVNPFGITVGAGAVVDTAGFTASTLKMSDADALAGRLRFAGDGNAGALSVNGNIVSRGGDVVLIAPNVSTGSGAVIQAPGGSAILAAGQSVEVTGRGLEGIVLQVQAPQDQAVNLGTLQGDAVGIFAGTLKHSGLIRANAVSAEGGKVVLKAQGDALVDGRIGAAAGDKGGSVDVLGHRVGLMAGAAIDASGAAGGGTVRVGGDFHGANPDVPNAQRTYVDPSAAIHADATQSGDGGKVAVWADDQTQGYGTITARGGAQGGDGGFVEVSGKQKLAFGASVDTAAPRGKTGTLLLDPTDIDVASGGTDGYPGGSLGVAFGDAPASMSIDPNALAGASSNVILQATNDITFSSPLSMSNNGVGLSAAAGRTISVNAPITTRGGAITLGGADPAVGGSEGSVYVNAALDTTGAGTVPAGANITIQSPLSDVGGTSVRIAGASSSSPVQLRGGTSGRVSIDGQAVDLQYAQVSGGQISLNTDNGSIAIDSSAITSASGPIYISAGQGTPSGSDAVSITNSTLDAGSGVLQITGSTAGDYAWGVKLDGVTLSAGAGTTVSGDNQSTSITYGGGGVWIQNGLDGAGSLGVYGSTGNYGDGIELSSANLTRLGAALTLAGSAPGGWGVDVASSTLATGGAALTITSADPVYINTSSIDTTGGAGQVSIAGASVTLQSAGVTSAGGAISITGTPNEVSINASSIGSNGGNIAITGGSATYWGDGVAITGGSSVHAGTGDVNISGQTQTGGAGFLLDSGGGPALTVSGRDVTISGTTSLGSGYSAVQINNEVVEGSQSVQISAVNGNLDVYGSTITAGSGGIGANADSGSAFISYSTLSSSGGAISVQAGQALAPTSASGVKVDTSVLDAGAGTIVLKGTTQSIYDWGVDFVYGGTSLAAGGGTTIIGTNTGTSLGSGAGGVRLTEDGALTVHGPLSVTGSAADAYGTGVVATWMTLTSDAAVSIDGTGGYYGVDLSGSGTSISMATGGLTVTGSSVNIGSAQITLADNAAVSVDATGGVYLTGSTLSSGAASVRGQWVSLDSSSLTTGGGAVSVGATGGDVYLSATTIATAGGNIAIDGGVAFESNGVSIVNGSTLQAGGGDIGIRGEAVYGRGVYIDGSALGGANLSVEGTSTLSSGWAGVEAWASTLTASSSLAIRANGDLAINGTQVQNAGSGPLSLYATTGASRLTIDSASSVQQSGGADLTLAADSMTLQGSIGSGAGRTVIMPTTSTRGIWIDGTDDANHLTLDPAALQGITAGALVIGSASHDGGLDVLAPLTLMNANVLSLVQASTGSIGQASGAILTVPSLNASGGGVALAEGNDVQVLSGSATAAGFRFNHAGSSLQIGTVDGTSGIQAAGGTILVTTPGVLQLTQPVASNAPASSNAITLAAQDLSTSGAGSLLATNDRWAVFLQAPPGAGLAGSPVSGNDAVWNRSFAGSTASSLPETGNRYVFAYQPQVTITAAPATKVYDSTDIFTGLTASVSGIPDASVSGNVFNQDVVGVTLNPAIGFKNVGTYTGAITLSAVALPAGYSSSIGFAPGDATITPATLTISATGETRTYDATTTGFATPSVAGLFGSDTVTGLSQSFDSKNVGSRTLGVNGGYAINDGNEGANYTVSLAGASGSITPATLTVGGLTANDKVYDATTAASFAGTATVTGVFAGDSVGIGGGAWGAFADRNAGTGKAVTLDTSSLSLTGLDAANYVIAATAGYTANITPAPLTLSARSDSRTYDATTASAVLPTVSGLLGTDTVGSLAQSFDSKNAGSRTLNVSGGYVVSDGNGGANYTVSLAGAGGSITPATLTLSAQTDGRTYNGTVDSAMLPSVSGLFGSDTINGLSQSFDSRHAGARSLSVNGGYAVNDGNGGANYTVSLAGASGSITPATLTLNAQTDSRTYDASANSNVLPSVSGLFGGDTVSSITQSFDSKNVGSRTLSVNGGYAVSDGNGGGNYTVSLITAGGSITPATLTIAGLSANDKVYDATTAATLSGAAALTGVFQGDSVTFSATPTGLFADKNVGTGKPVTMNTAGALGGIDAGNYLLVAPTNLSASITPAPLTVVAIDQNKQLGATFAFTGAEIAVTGLKGGERVTSASLSSGGALAGASFGNYPITVGGPLVGVSGFADSNYRVTYQPGTLVVSPVDTPATQQVNNTLVTFLQLFVQESAPKPADKPKGDPDVVVTDTSCKPS